MPAAFDLQVFLGVLRQLFKREYYFIVLRKIAPEKILFLKSVHRKKNQQGAFVPSHLGVCTTCELLKK